MLCRSDGVEFSNIVISEKVDGISGQTVFRLELDIDLDKGVDHGIGR